MTQNRWHILSFQAQTLATPDRATLNLVDRTGASSIPRSTPPRPYIILQTRLYSERTEELILSITEL